MAQPSTVARQAAAMDVDRRLAAAGTLQEVLIDLIDLSLQGKQAHWNLRGRSFRDLHLQLDELVELARTHSDILAERCLALGVAADGRVGTVAGGTHLDPFPEGRVADHELVELVVARLQTVSEVARARLGELGDIDPVSQDLVNEALEDVEKQLWMFEAHRPADGA
jgi:starvation-inducible DNA-binding protein